MKRILVVDDRYYTKQALKDLLENDLENIELEIDTVGCGEQAVAIQGDLVRYDLIMMNYQMGNMSGAETIREIRKMGFGMPIIGYSGWKRYKKAMLEAGADDFWYMGPDTNIFDLPKLVRKHL